jgi:glycopeptide antibiotics resistance protein
MMNKSPRRVLFLLAFMFFLTAGNVARLYDKYPVRPIMAVWLVAMGMLLGALVFTLGRTVREKNNDGK